MQDPQGGKPDAGRTEPWLGGGPDGPESIHFLQAAHHQQWTRMIVSTLVVRGHDPDQATEASQMAFVELWMRPEQFDVGREGGGPIEARLYAWLRRRAVWRARDLRRRMNREVPCDSLTGGCEHADHDGPAWPDDPADLLLEPDEAFWVAMNTTELCHRPNCHTEAIACCLAGETQRSAAEKFSTSASTLNRQLAFFKARYALLGRPGSPSYDVHLVRGLRRRGLQLVVMLRHEVEADESLYPRVPCFEAQEESAWICQVGRPSERRSV